MIMGSAAVRLGGRIRSQILHTRQPLAFPANSRAFSMTTVAHAGQGPSPGSGPPPGTPVRVNIGIFGAMNAGKSTLMNLLTQSNTSIVDSTPGTTADTKIATMELHKLGPCKIFDTAGLDEGGQLGDKKRAKALTVAKESDLVVIVVDAKKGITPYEEEVIELAKKRKKNVVFIVNTKIDDSIPEQTTYMGMPAIKCAVGVQKNMGVIAEFLETEYTKNDPNPQPLLPLRYLGSDKTVFMNIPMDAETPGGRLLRPQARVQEFCLSNFTSTFAFRMDLAAGRSFLGEAARDREKERFQTMLERTQPSLVVTDSQAMDLVHPWLDRTKFPSVDLTTFSILMINDMSGGNLQTFVDGLKAFDGLQAGQNVLIAEACNHNRLSEEICLDISTQQIPRKIKSLFGPDVHIDHTFGREFPDIDLNKYSLVIHCGGCMVDKQKIKARVEDCQEQGIPITNFGLLLSHFQAPAAVERVLRPWL